jgi:hypothetical protein
MKGVAIAGHRGGSGKTSIAHSIALGAAWNGVPAYLFHTDKREPIITTNRPYQYYDARDHSVLIKLVDAAMSKQGLCIIDGGGNRPEFDKWVAKSVDLTIIPICPDPEDVIVGLEHKKRLLDAGATNVKFLINKYPGSKVERNYVNKNYLCKIPKTEIIGTLPLVGAIRQLRSSDTGEFERPPSRVNNFSRQVYQMVSKELKRIK